MIGAETRPTMGEMRRAPCIGQRRFVSCWPFALESDVRSNVGYGVLTGLVILTLSFVDPDPTRTRKSHQSHCRRACFIASF